MAAREQGPAASSSIEKPLSRTQLETRFLLLSALRWLPVGLVLGLTTLIPLERGISLAGVGVILSLQGFVVLGLELPTGGLADTWSRKNLLVVAGTIATASAVIFTVASSAWMFATAMILQGVFRALDSGPMESWYVDEAHAAGDHDRVPPMLSRVGAVMGVGLAGGAAISGLLVWWHPIASQSALTLPFIVSTALTAAYTAAIALLMREMPRAATPGSSPANPVRAITEGLGMLRRSRVLAALVAVEVFWAAAMIGFETLTPIRLVAFTGSEAGAQAVFGPASAVAWGVFALGSWAAGPLSRRIGVAPTAIVARLLNGAFVIAMGFAGGIAGVLAAYGACYATHGMAGPMHSTLLHAQTDAGHRTTVLSINSMIANAGYSVLLIAATSVAGRWSPSVALVAVGTFSLLGAACYVPALREKRFI